MSIFVHWKTQFAQNRRILTLLFLFKTTYLLAVLGAVSVWPDLDEHEFFNAFQRWPREGGPIPASHFATWDTAHYLYLSEVGYSSGACACAFYPLWPLLVRWLSPLLAGKMVLTGLLLSNACSLSAWMLFHRLVMRRWGETAANWSLVFLIVFPGSLFFQFSYTESLFFLLLMILWWALDAHQLTCIWLAGCLLPLTRPIGVFMVLPMAFHILKKPWRLSHDKVEALLESLTNLFRPQVRATGKINCEADDKHWGSGCNLRTFMTAQPLWLLTAPLLGWVVYLALMWKWTGNPFEGFAAQKYWGVHSITNLCNLPKFVASFFTPTDWHTYGSSVLERTTFVLLLYCIPVIWRLGKTAIVWTYVLAILPAMSGSFISFTRYMSCAFPVFIALGVFLSPRERRWPRYALLAMFTGLHVFLLWRFVNFRWAG